MKYLLSFPVCSNNEEILLTTFLKKHQLTFKTLQVPLHYRSSFGNLMEMSDELTNLLKILEDLFLKILKERNKHLDLSIFLQNFKFQEKFISDQISQILDFYKSDVQILKNNFDKKVFSYMERKNKIDRIEILENGNLKEKSLFYILKDNQYLENDNDSIINLKISFDEVRSVVHYKNDSFLGSGDGSFDSSNNENNIDIQDADIQDENNIDIQDDADIDIKDENNIDNNNIKEKEGFEFLMDFFIVKPINEKLDFQYLLPVKKVVEEENLEMIHFLGIRKKEEEIRKYILSKNYILKDNDRKYENKNEKENKNNFNEYTKNYETFLDTYMLNCLELIICMKLTKLYTDSVLSYGLPTKYIFYLVEMKNEKNWEKIIGRFEFGKKIDWNNIPREKVECFDEIEN